MGKELTDLGKPTPENFFGFEALKEESEAAANDVVKDLNEAIEHGRMTYPGLINILRFYLKKTIDEVTIFKPEVAAALSVRKEDLKKLRKILKRMEKKEKKQGLRHDYPA